MLPYGGVLGFLAALDVSGERPARFFGGTGVLGEICAALAPMLAPHGAGMGPGDYDATMHARFESAWFLASLLWTFGDADGALQAFETVDGVPDYYCRRLQQSFPGTFDIYLALAGLSGPNAGLVRPLYERFRSGDAEGFLAHRGIVARPHHVAPRVRLLARIRDRLAARAGRRGRLRVVHREAALRLLRVRSPAPDAARDRDLLRAYAEPRHERPLRHPPLPGRPALLQPQGREPGPLRPRRPRRHRAPAPRRLRRALRRQRLHAGNHRRSPRPARSASAHPPPRRLSRGPRPRLSRRRRDAGDRRPLCRLRPGGPPGRRQARLLRRRLQVLRLRLPQPRPRHGRASCEINSGLSSPAAVW